MAKRIIQQFTKDCAGACKFIIPLFCICIALQNLGNDLYLTDMKFGAAADPFFEESSLIVNDYKNITQLYTYN
jgi:hypothetical protein